MRGAKTAKSWHTGKIDDVMRELDVTHDGLASQEAQERLKKHGYNELVAKKRKSAFSMFLGQFKDVFILLLIVAIIFSAIIGYYEVVTGTAEAFEAFADALIIGIIVLMVAITGFVQEFRAEKAIEAMKKMTAPKAHVIRDGREVIVHAREIVPAKNE